MVEIAIAIGVIAFALVAIIGILPLGLNVQKDNREDTIVAQDGQYFMDLLRYGRQGTNSNPASLQGSALDFLTNYVETIEIKTYSGSNVFFPTLVSDVTYATLNAPEVGIPGNAHILTNGHVIVGMLSIPKYQPAKDGSSLMWSNDVVATVRAMSGSAMEQYGGNQAVAFKYQMDVTLMPYSTTPWMIDTYTNFPVGNSDLASQTNLTQVQNQLHYLQNGLIDSRLKFSWPVLPNGSPGPNRRYFSTLVSGRFQDISFPDLQLYVINPGAYNISNSTIGINAKFF